jgi:hypothetical protein
MVDVVRCHIFIIDSQDSMVRLLPACPGDAPDGAEGFENMERRLIKLAGDFVHSANRDSRGVSFRVSSFMIDLLMGERKRI